MRLSQKIGAPHTGTKGLGSPSGGKFNAGEVVKRMNKRCPLSLGPIILICTIGVLTSGCGTSDENTVRVGEVTSISTKATCAPTSEALTRIMDSRASKDEFLGTIGREARGAGWVGPVFLAPPDRVKILERSRDQTRVSIVEMSGSPSSRVLDANQRECWVPTYAITGSVPVAAKSSEPKAEEANAAVPQSTKILTQADFNGSGFCRQYGCKQGESYADREGGTNYTYEITTPHISVDVRMRDSIVTQFGLSFYERDVLSKSDFDLIQKLVQSTDEARQHAKTIAFIKQHIEQAVCSSCSVPKDGRTTVDGSFRVSVGKSGREQVVSFERIKRT